MLLCPSLLADGFVYVLWSPIVLQMGFHSCPSPVTLTHQSLIVC